MHGASTIAVVYWLYSALLVITLVLSAPWWLWQMLRYGKYRSGWSERLGSVPRQLRAHEGAPTIWIHAVSVGEVLAVTRLIAEIKVELRNYRIIVSTTTDTGQKLARQKFGEQNVFRAPLDLPWAVQAFLDALRPRLLVLAESEFWPNLLHNAQRSGAAVAVVNARVSDRSLPRYQRFRWLFMRVLADVDLLLAQSEEDARRLIAIGAPAERVHVGGNLKFEVKPPARGDVHAWLTGAIHRDGIGPVIVAGSTLEGEEAMLLEAFRAIRSRYAEAMLILAPRHPERFDAVAALLAVIGIALYAAFVSERSPTHSNVRNEWGTRSLIRQAEPRNEWGIRSLIRQAEPRNEWGTRTSTRTVVARRSRAAAGFDRRVGEHL